MSLMTITGHDGKKVDVDPERIEGLEYDDQLRATRIFLFGGQWITVVMPRQDIRKAIDVELETRRTFADIEGSKQRLVEAEAAVKDHDRRLGVLREKCSVQPTEEEARAKLAEARTGLSQVGGGSLDDR